METTSSFPFRGKCLLMTYEQGRGWRRKEKRECYPFSALGNSFRIRCINALRRVHILHWRLNLFCTSTDILPFKATRTKLNISRIVLTSHCLSGRPTRWKRPKRTRNGGGNQDQEKIIFKHASQHTACQTQP